MPHALLRRGAKGRSPFIEREGQWQASWLPPRLAAWPFDLVAAPTGGHALALHEESDLVTQGPGGQAHLAWMAKAERLLTAAPPPRPSPSFDRQRMAAGSRFLAALAADAFADEALIQLPELSRQ